MARLLAIKNCVGPREAFATDNRAGCAYVRIVSTVTGEEVGPQTKELQATIPASDSLDGLSRAIEQLGREVDVVVVALHKGIVHTPALLAGMNGRLRARRSRPARTSWSVITPISCEG